MTRLRPICAWLVVCALVLAGCAAQAATPRAVAQASVTGLDPAALVDARTPYVGDASAVLETMQATGMTMGEYTISIQSAAEPYGLTVTLQSWPEDVDRDEAVTRRAALLIGLIENLGYVEWVGPGERAHRRLDVAGADELAGRDVKASTADESAVRDLLDALG